MLGLGLGLGLELGLRLGLGLARHELDVEAAQFAHGDVLQVKSFIMRSVRKLKSSDVVLCFDCTCGKLCNKQGVICLILLNLAHRHDFVSQKVHTTVFSCANTHTNTSRSRHTARIHVGRAQTNEIM